MPVILANNRIEILRQLGQTTDIDATAQKQAYAAGCLVYACTGGILCLPHLAMCQEARAVKERYKQNNDTPLPPMRAVVPLAPGWPGEEFVTHAAFSLNPAPGYSPPSFTANMAVALPAVAPARDLDGFEEEPRAWASAPEPAPVAVAPAPAPALVPVPALDPAPALAPALVAVAPAPTSASASAPALDLAPAPAPASTPEPQPQPQPERERKPEPYSQLEVQNTTVAGWLEGLKLEAFLPALEGLGYDDLDLLKEGDEDEMADVRTLMIECCVHTFDY